MRSKSADLYELHNRLYQMLSLLGKEKSLFPEALVTVLFVVY
jgi:hypothetical protein